MREEYESNNLPADYSDGELVPSSELTIDGPVQDPFGALCDITTHVCDCVTSWKQMDLEMHRMDVELDAFIAKASYDLEKYKESIPVVEHQLNFVNEQISKILDHVLLMDAKTDVELKMKMRMLDSSENYLDKLSSMMMKLL